MISGVPEARFRILTPLRNRNFALLWAGMTVSLLGDGIYLVAIAWEALRLSNTTVAISLVGIAWTLPTVVFLLIGGWLSDRIDRRRLMIWTSIVQALAIGTLGLLVTLGAVRLVTMLLLVAIYGGAEAFFLPAFEAIVPTILSRGELTEASAVEQFIRPLTFQFLGPAIGGVLIAITGTGTGFLIDAGTFCVAACAVMAMRIPRPWARSARTRGERALTGLGQAVRFVCANRWLWRTLLAAGVMMLLYVGPSQVLLPYVVKNVLHAGSDTLGMIRACGGVGALIAAFTVAQRGLPGWPVRAMLAGWALQCLMIAGYAVAARAWVFCAVTLTGAAGGAAGSVVWGAMMKTRVPNEMLGRVASLDYLVSIGLVPVSFALTGPVAQLLGAQATMLGSGLLAAATMLLFALWAGSNANADAAQSPARQVVPDERLALRRRDRAAVAASPSRSAV